MCKLLHYTALFFSQTLQRGPGAKATGLLPKGAIFLLSGVMIMGDQCQHSQTCQESCPDTWMSTLSSQFSAPRKKVVPLNHRIDMKGKRKRQLWTKSGEGKRLLFILNILSPLVSRCLCSNGFQMFPCPRCNLGENGSPLLCSEDGETLILGADLQFHFHPSPRRE